jgi:DNA-binding winged helix-turn-helix (wHTH) protein
MLWFADFHLDPRTRQLRRGGVPLTLRGVAFEVLQALVERPGEIIDKPTLCKRAWPGRAVDDDNLQVEIAALRKLVGRHAIVTAAGRGYQFTWPVAARNPTDAGPAAARWHDLQAIDALLAPGSLVTLTGEGGSGKSHLARALAGRRRCGPAGAADGHCYIDMTAPDAADALRAVMAAPAPGLQQDSAAGGPASLCVLDGADRWLAGLAGMVAAWRSCHRCAALLLTTRERLHVPAERVYRMRPLGPVSALALFEQCGGPAGALELCDRSGHAPGGSCRCRPARIR